mmetsp:Transcript_10500/g.18318  ORF Transcript_10500/g.18318 Transcript_10500/m.18318 type:complete len:288 (+) Transcript_10500:1104-1967(+)
MGQHVAVELVETAQDLLSRRGQVVQPTSLDHIAEVLLHLLVHLAEHLLVLLDLTGLFVFGVEVLPVSHEELQALEWLHFLGSRSSSGGLGWCGGRRGISVIGSLLRGVIGLCSRLLLALDITPAGVLLPAFPVLAFFPVFLAGQEGHTAVLGEQREVLQIVLLNALVHVVDLEATDKGGQTKDLCSERHGRLVVEHTLSVHEQNSQFLTPRGLGGADKWLRPHPNARGLTLLAASPREAGLLLECRLARGGDFFHTAAIADLTLHTLRRGVLRLDQVPASFVHVSFG